MMVLFKSTSLLALLSLSLTARTAEAFGPSTGRAFTTSSTFSNTRLYISSWGAKGPPSRWATAERENPEEKVQAYLKEPEAVEARVNIDGTCLVSGLVNDPDRTDQFLFDLLNHEESAFEFDKIVAFTDNSKFSKKRLLSRSARYTGLLDKLSFTEATSPGALPTVEQLEGVKSWLACLSGENVLEQLKEVAETAKAAPSVENVAVLLMNANGLDAEASAAAVEVFHEYEEKPLQYTIVVVGQLEDRPEGEHAYQYAELGTERAVLPETATFAREEAYRMVTELLQLEAGVNKALAFAEVYNVNATEAKLVKGLREAGYARPQEIDHMMREGPEAYKKAIEEFKTANPDYAKGYTTNAWWEAEEFQKSRRASAERDAAKEQVVKDERTKEIEDVAREWGKREYFRQSMAGTVENDMTEEAFIESVWDRAMFEGDLKYRQMKGEVVDEEAELIDFKSRQERKQKTMLERAKEELAEILDDDGLDGDELRAKFLADDEEDAQRKKD